MKKISASSLNLRSIWFYIAVGAAFIIEAYLAFIVLPGTVSSMMDKRSEIEADEKEVADLTTVVGSIQKIDQAELETAVAKTTAAMPNEKKTSGIIYGMSKLAGDNGVVVNNLEFSPGLVSTRSGTIVSTEPVGQAVGSGVKQISATLTVSGELSKIVDFLVELRRSSQIIGVNRVEYALSASRANTGIISLMIYYQPPKNNAQDDPKSVPFMSEADKEIISDLPETDVFTVQQ